MYSQKITVNMILNLFMNYDHMISPLFNYNEGRCMNVIWKNLPCLIYSLRLNQGRKLYFHWFGVNLFICYQRFNELKVYTILDVYCKDLVNLLNGNN